MRLGPEWKLTPWRAAVHLPSATAVLADLHLGYAATRRAIGEAVPDCGTAELDERLVALHHLGVRRLVIAGDLVERGRVNGPEAAAWVQTQVWCGFELLLVPGNHDADLPTIPGLKVAREPVLVGGWDVRHEPGPGPCLAGHLHPVLRLPRYPGSVPCYLWHQGRLILPAQSDDAAGVNVLSRPPWHEAECLAIVRGEVVDLGTVRRLRRRHAPLSPTAWNPDRTSLPT